jgi:phage replication O-like protein O
MEEGRNENGFFKIPHEMAEALMRINLTKYQSRILWVVLRQTLGWHKEFDWIANRRFVELTGMKKGHVSRSLKELILKKIVTHTGNYKRYYSKDKRLSYREGKLYRKGREKEGAVYC